MGVHDDIVCCAAKPRSPSKNQLLRGECRGLLPAGAAAEGSEAHGESGLKEPFTWNAFVFKRVLPDR